MPTPSRANVIGGGGEGVCAVTETSKEDECAADDGANEIAFLFLPEFFRGGGVSGVVQKRSG